MNASGGTNMMALLRDMSGNHPARTALVLSNNPDARGIDHAAALGVPTAAVNHRDFGGDRAAFENIIDGKLSILTFEFDDSGRVVRMALHVGGEGGRKLPFARA